MDACARWLAPKASLTDLCETGKFAGKTGIVRLFSRVEPQVFQKNEFSILHCRHGQDSPGPDCLGERFDRSLYDLRQASRYRSQPELLVHHATRSAEMGAEDDPGLLVDQVRYGGKTGPDPGIILDFTV